MRTLKEITTELTQLLAVANNGHKRKPAELSRMRKRVQFLTLCKNYLESKPNLEFLEKEQERLENRLSLINEGFDSWKINYKGKDPLKEYNKMMGVTDVKDKRRAIMFLLN
jgi:hypothetical protein